MLYREHEATDDLIPLLVTTPHHIRGQRHAVAIRCAQPLDVGDGDDRIERGVQLVQQILIRDQAGERPRVVRPNRGRDVGGALRLGRGR